VRGARKTARPCRAKTIARRTSPTVPSRSRRSRRSRGVIKPRRNRCSSREAPFVGAVSEELRRLSSFEERHRRLLARLTLVVAATAVVDACGTAVIYFLERHAHGTEVQSVGQAFFFTTVQLLTVSSQLKNPITPAGRALDIALELWAIIVVAGAAGAIAAFFQNADSQ